MVIEITITQFSSETDWLKKNVTGKPKKEKSL